MTAIDYGFLAAAVLLLVLMLVCSRMIRAIAWETVRHPFRASRVAIRDGKLSVTRQEPSRENESQPRTPAGAR